MALLPDRLSSGDVYLRRWRPAMAEELLDAVTSSHEELRFWMPWAQGAPSRDELAHVLSNGVELFDADKEWNYVLFENSSGDLVGAGGLHVVDDPNCPEIGYWIRSDRTGRGYATAAAKALADAAFRHLVDVHQVKIRMDKANVASAAVPPKLGFRLLKEEDRTIEAEGHTGRGYVWVLDRERTPS
ncbi:MAG: GNAT family N-acetyltransferase [Acidimicrobiales bacterium]